MKSYLVIDQKTGAITNVISTFFMPKKNDDVFFLEKDASLDIDFLQHDYRYEDGEVIQKPKE